MIIKGSVDIFKFREAVPMIENRIQTVPIPRSVNQDILIINFSIKTMLCVKFAAYLKVNIPFHRP